MYTQCWRGNPEKKKDRWEDKLVYGKVMLKFIFKRGYGRAWSGFVLSQNWDYCRTVTNR